MEDLYLVPENVYVNKMTIKVTQCTFKIWLFFFSPLCAGVCGTLVSTGDKWADTFLFKGPIYY